MPFNILQKATIVGYDPDTNTMQVTMSYAPACAGSYSKKTFDIKYSPSLWNNNGLFIGTFPAIGTTIIVGQGDGGEYRFDSFDLEGFADCRIN